MKLLVTLFLTACLAVASVNSFFLNSIFSGWFCKSVNLSQGQRARITGPANRCVKVACPDAARDLLELRCEQLYSCKIFGIRQTCATRKSYSMKQGSATIVSPQQYRCDVQCFSVATPRPEPSSPEPVDETEVQEQPTQPPTPRPVNPTDGATEVQEQPTQPPTRQPVNPTDGATEVQEQPTQPPTPRPVDPTDAVTEVQTQSTTR